MTLAAGWSQADEEFYGDYLQYTAGVDVSETAEEIEAKGWRHWLMKLMPFRFEEDFSEDHIKFWDLFWSVLGRIKKQQELFKAGNVPTESKAQVRFFKRHGCYIYEKEYAVLLILGRGMAKSSSLEGAAVMRGCLLVQGYFLEICESQDQAEEHLGNVREMIEHDESRVLEFYPHMAVNPNAIVNGKKTKDRTDLFITIGGWIARAKGLNSNLRGLRIGGLRPDYIVIDDCDGVNDSIAVSVKKAKQISSSIIPTQARRWAMIHFGQNLITETGVMNQLYTGKIDILAQRTTIGASNTFVNFREGIEYRTYMDEADGRIKHQILDAAMPTWSGVNIAQAQKFLNDSGLDTFLAEYQNSFEHQKTEKVYHAWDEKRHVITWSMFARVFGKRHIPGHWRAKAAGDIGYSKESRSAWFWAARAAQNSPLPMCYFGYRSRTYTMTSIDDQAVDMWEAMFPDPDTGREHFESTQRFSEYPELFRLLNLKPRCGQYLKRFAYDHSTNTYKEPPIDPARAKTDPNYGEELALWHVRQAQKGWKSQIGLWQISHEKTGEQKTLAQKYGLPVSKTKDFKDWDGVVEANNLLHGDFTQAHPFYPDEQDSTTGLYRLGCPYLFIIVDDDQIKNPRNDDGFKDFREEVAAQRTTEEKLTEQGLSKSKPLKYKADHPDAFRMWAKNYTIPSATPLTMREKFVRNIPEEHRYKPKEERNGTPEITVEKQMAMQEAREQAAEQLKRDLGITDEDFDYGFEEDDW